MSAAALALVPEPHEVLNTLCKLSAPLLFALDNPGLGTGSRHVRPARELATVLERKIEQCGEHHGGELNRYRIVPIELLVNGD